MACISTVGQLGQDVRRVLQLDPVELDVLARGEMAVALVVAARDVRQLAHLPRRQRAVGNGDAQHVGVELQIEAVHQPQRLELVLGQLAGEAAVHLVAELRDALVDEGLVVVVVAVHRAATCGPPPRSPSAGGRTRGGCWGRARAGPRGSARLDRAVLGATPGSDRAPRRCGRPRPGWLRRCSSAASELVVAPRG